MNITFNPTDLLFTLVPLVIAAVVRPDWSPWLKTAAALGVCVLAAIIQIIFQGQFSFQALDTTVSKIFMVVMTSYAVFWKKNLPANWLNWVESNINGGTTPAPTEPPK